MIKFKNPSKQGKHCNSTVCQIVCSCASSTVVGCNTTAIKSLCKPCTCAAIHMNLLSCRKRHKDNNEKPSKIWSDSKAKRCGAGQETKVVNCGISASGHSRAISGPGMCVTKVTVLQNKSKACHFKVYKLLLCCMYDFFFFVEGLSSKMNANWMQLHWIFCKDVRL